VRSAERLLGDSLDAQTAANGLETIRYKIERLYERYEPEPDPEPDDDLRLPVVPVHLTNLEPCANCQLASRPRRSSRKVDRGFMPIF
jgi:hypothetical protein